MYVSKEIESMRKFNSKFVVFVDHYAGMAKYDCYVALEGNTVLEAIKSFEKKFDTYALRNSVYLFKMMQRKPHATNLYGDILVNRGHGWNTETSPVETFAYDYEIKSFEKYEEE